MLSSYSGKSHSLYILDRWSTDWITSTSHPVGISRDITSFDILRHKEGLMHVAWVSQCRHSLCRPHKQLARTYDQLTECQWLESFPLHQTSQAGTRWFSVTWQVDNSTGDSWMPWPAGLLGSKEFPVQSWLNLAQYYLKLCLLCHYPQCGDHWCWIVKIMGKKGYKIKPDMLLLGAEQLAGITFVLHVGQLVTNMIPEAIVPLINSRLLES